MNMNCSVGRYLKIHKHSALEMKRDERQGRKKEKKNNNNNNNNTPTTHHEP